VPGAVLANSIAYLISTTEDTESTEAYRTPEGYVRIRSLLSLHQKPR
jgi:hypothetical protein